jgi:RecA-family ATPase
MPFGTVTLIAGAPGVGKTAMVAEWCQRWRDGRTICGKPTNRPTGFYYLAADRQWKSHQIWFELVGFSDIPHYSLADDTTYDLEKFKHSHRAYTCFLEGLEKLKPIPGSHVFVDPVSPLYISGDANRARDVAASMLRFSRVCQEKQINLSCLAHFGKQKNDPKEQYARPQDRISGSGAFVGFSDTQVYLIDPVPPKQPYHILGWNPRHAQEETFQFVRNKQGLFVPFNLFTELDRLQAVLECVPYEPTETSIILQLICTTLKVSDATAERYLQHLVGTNQVTKVKRGIYHRTKPS